MDTTVEDRVLPECPMVRGEQVVATGLNILVNRGKWVNGKTPDDVFATVTGYYIPSVS